MIELVGGGSVVKGARTQSSFIQTRLKQYINMAFHHDFTDWLAVWNENKLEEDEAVRE